MADQMIPDRQGALVPVMVQTFPMERVGRTEEIADAVL
jgi:hypothetical protein